MRPGGLRCDLTADSGFLGHSIDGLSARIASGGVGSRHESKAAPHLALA